MVQILLKKLELLNLESNKNGNLQDNVTFFSNIDYLCCYGIVHIHIRYFIVVNGIVHIHIRYLI